MTVANTNSSPRDLVADSNSELARKRQRLLDHPSPGPDDSSVVVVEAVESDIKPDFTDCIDIVDLDDDIIMEPYSNDFSYFNDITPPAAQMNNLQTLFAHDGTVNPDLLACLSTWLASHLASTRNDEANWSDQYLHSDTAFFYQLAQISIRFLESSDPFDFSTRRRKQALFRDLLHQLATLSARIIRLLPDSLKTLLSRRDSMQPSSQPRTHALIIYLLVAQRVVSPATPAVISFREADAADTHDLMHGVGRKFFTPHTLDAVVQIGHIINDAPANVGQAWPPILEVFRLVRIAVGICLPPVDFPRSSVEQALTLLITAIMPAIRNKHPRALPPGFHSEMVSIGEVILRVHALTYSAESAFALWNEFVKRDGDALLVEAPDEDDAQDSLWNACDNDLSSLADLLSVSWAMQEAHAFLCSGVMDVRNIGLNIWGCRLHDVYRQHAPAKAMTSPIVSYMVRFLKKNEVTRYIFGAESHAAIVSNSGMIICFLAATETLTDAETDILWRACTTSVEADFVKATFMVLSEAITYLDVDRLVHILDKYATTKLERIGVDAVSFLSPLFTELERKMAEAGQPEQRLQIALVTIDILKKSSQGSLGPINARLRALVYEEITRLCQSSLDSADKLQICKRCAPEILDRTENATVAAELLQLVLVNTNVLQEGQIILSMIPVPSAVEELCSFVDFSKQKAEESVIREIMVRLVFIVQLMAVDMAERGSTSSEEQESVQERLFNYTMGENALCDNARDEAWDTLHRTAVHERSTAINELVQMYLLNFVPRLPATAATPRLIKILALRVATTCQTEDFRAEPMQLLDDPVWLTLVRFARSSSIPLVANVVTSTISDILLTNPDMAKLPNASVERCQTNFVRTLIEKLHSDYTNLRETGTLIERQQLSHTLRLLDAVIMRSRQIASAIGLVTPEGKIIVEASPDDTAEPIIFTIQVNNIGASPMPVKVQAPPTTSVTQVARMMAERTGAPSHRMVLDGREIETHNPDTSLADAGLHSSAVVQASARHVFSLDLSYALPHIGPMERQVLEQYHLLESFLDGPNAFAHQAFNFLRGMQTPIQSRIRVTSASSSLEQIFPPTQMWRSAFSLHVLRGHLRDSARLGLADPTFIMRGVHLLTSLLLDKTRALGGTFLLEICMSLLEFLRERPSDSTTLPYFLDGPAFVSRMLGVLAHAKDMTGEAAARHSSRISFRANLTSTVYKVLSEGFTLDASLWHVFAGSSNMAALHVQLLLDQDQLLSTQVSETIRILLNTLPPEGVHAYWTAINQGRSEALAAGQMSGVYFDLSSDVLGADTIIHTDESSMMALVAEVSEQVLSHSHTELAILTASDRAMIGLLQLLQTALAVLKSRERPLMLKGLSLRIFQRLLFPDHADTQARPLVHKESRDLAYRVMWLSYEPGQDTQELLGMVRGLGEIIPDPPTVRYPGHGYWSRLAGTCSGLTNLGMTCYMNSLMQQLFANLQFRHFVMQLPLEGIPDLLDVLRALFARMQESLSPTTDTTCLAEALNVEVGNQEDVHGFYAILLARLEDCMPTPDHKIALSKFFSGKFITQVRGECGHVSSREEEFSDLSITVKNKSSLHESLAEFVQGEPMEGANKYKCLRCQADSGGQLVNAVRRTCLENIPPSLTFCLKRFAFDANFDGENKVNDRFDFPLEIDMAVYSRAHLENPDQPWDPDIFELVGVIVHQGSLAFGHYWSYVRIPNASRPDENIWVYLEDSNVNFCAKGAQDVQEQCFGGLCFANGNERADNAYVLFYQRREYIAEAKMMISREEGRGTADSFSLPRAMVPDRIMQEIFDENGARKQMEFLFDENFAELVRSLMASYTGFYDSSKPDSPAQQPPSPAKTEPAENTPDGEVDGQLVQMALTYCGRVLEANVANETGAKDFEKSFSMLIRTNPVIALKFLRAFSDGSHWCKVVALHPMEKYRVHMYEILVDCLTTVRENCPAAYKDITTQLMTVHASLLDRPSTAFYSHWEDYLEFAGRIASFGRLETGVVLGSAYLDWALDAVLVQAREDCHARRPAFANWVTKCRPDFAPVYNFLHAVLNGHVDMTNLSDPADHGRWRDQGAGGWKLTESEIERLWCCRKIWVLYSMAMVRCAPTQDWRDYAPGKLIGLLAGADSDPRCFELAQTTLLDRYTHQNNNLEPMLQVTLHLCRVQDEAQMRHLLTMLAKNLCDWDGYEGKSLNFMSEAYIMAPASIVDSVHIWGHDFLLAKAVANRRAAAAWLTAHIFNRDPISDDHNLDTSRVRSVRALIAQCAAKVRNACIRERERPTHKPMAQSFSQALKYLARFVANVKAAASEADVKLSQGISIEYGEAERALAQHQGLVEDLEPWIAEPPSTRMTTVTLIGAEGGSEQEDDEGEDSSGEELSSAC